MHVPIYDEKSYYFHAINQCMTVDDYFITNNG